MRDINIKITTKGDVPRVISPRPAAKPKKDTQATVRKSRITPGDISRMREYCDALSEVANNPNVKVSDAVRSNLDLFTLGVRDALRDIEDLHEEIQFGSQLLFEATVLLTVLAKDPTNKDVLNSARGWLQGFSQT